jgi:hypothetical protein
MLSGDFKQPPVSSRLPLSLDKVLANSILIAKAMAWRSHETPKNNLGFDRFEHHANIENASVFQFIKGFTTRGQKALASKARALD